MRRRALILYGGRSSEHGVSCLSARSVLAAIDRDRYEVVPVGITRGGRWVLTDGDIQTRPGRALPEVDDDGSTVALVLGRKGPALVRFDVDDDRYEAVSGIDVAFPVLHGPYGEDGTVQGLLATFTVPYVGADVTASSVGIDKRAMKNAFKARGLPQVPYLPVRRERWERERGALLDEIEGALSYPIFTKPARQGSSIGITKVKGRHQLEAGLQEAFEYDRVAIVEEGVEDLREIEVGALGNSEVAVTAPGEIVPSHEFYDFEAKYLDASELILPADLPDDLTVAFQETARQAYHAIGCRGMARIDFFLRGERDLFVNEINTIPGFTPSSMFPRLWQAEGLEYSALVSRLLELALEAAQADGHYAP
ncbi:MAG TPA: D-alanine--D-alanine ligase family protein [Nitriliruptorales bacterium]|nr:D-alanine--D-alanine ligase family protein [Nitriliruptorales bacterium]